MIGFNNAASATSLREISNAIRGIESELRRLEARLVALEGAWDGEAKHAAHLALARSAHSLEVMYRIGLQFRGQAVQTINNMTEMDRRRGGAWGR